MFDRLESAKDAKRVVFIGYDPTEDACAKILAHSIRSRTTLDDFLIIPIVRDEMLAYDICNRPIDPKGSTQFSITRFMVPHLMNYSGVAIFMDCDMIITRDIRELFEDLFDPSKAVQCVKHKYRPKADPKMGGKPQTTYPRKNWSSMVIYNCDHPDNRKLTREVVESETPAFLHRFQWLRDKYIGELPKEYNFLVGEFDMPEELPFNLHHTLGPPIYRDKLETDYSDLWKSEFEATFGRKFDPSSDVIDRVVDTPVDNPTPARTESQTA